MTSAPSAPDVATVTLLMLLATTLVLGLNWRMHPRMAGTGSWFAAHLAFAVAAALLMLRGRIPELPSIVLGNTCLLGGFLLMLRGTCAFAATRAPSRLMAALVLAVAGGSLYFHVVDPSYAARWWILGPAAAAASLWSLAVPQRALAREQGWLGVGVFAAATTLSATIMLAVPLGLSARETGVTHLFEPSASKAWGLAGASVMLALQAFGAVLLTAQRLQGELQRQALVDAMTGLPNRRAFDDALLRAVEGAQRAGGAVGLLLVDVDHFKRINDSHGHAQGDEVLREVARRFVAALRRVDFPARVGGEEFAAILDAPHPGALHEIAERVRLTMAATPVTTAKGLLRVTVSVGVAHVGSPGVDAVRALYHDADTALYAAKRAGRDRVVITGLVQPLTS